MTDVLAIIPARGGSKGVPRKNVALLAGVPLVAHTIAQALRTPSIKRVVVSTDDAEIGAVSTRWGAEVIRRPAEISGDTASSESALLHVLDELRTRDGYDPELVVFLQPTSPLRQPDDIQRAIDTLRRDSADSLFSASAVHGFVWRHDQSTLRSLSYDYRNRPRRQDAAEDLIENGSIYVFKPWVLRECGNRLGGVITVFRMSAADSFQVDEPADLALMEGLLHHEQRTSPSDTTRAALRCIRLLVLDFDGVMTDNAVWVAADGAESVRCHRGDGWGIARLLEAGVEVAVLSTERVAIAAARSEKLGIPCVHACDDKLSALQNMARARKLGQQQIAYVGNDMNDSECLSWVGMPIAVADARAEVHGLARWVTSARGGFGAVREVADALIAARSNGAPNGTNTDSMDLPEETP